VIGRQPSIVARLLRREDGVVLGTFLGTLGVLLLSVTVTGTILWATGRPTESLSLALPIAILIPLVVAPLFFWVSLSLLSELTGTRELLDRLTTIDDLTEVFNRRRFLDLAAREIDNAGRYQFSVALLVVDPDHLQDINSSYGQDSGDEVLRRIGKVCRATSRKGDLVGRFGGEEFWILLSHCVADDARLFSERVRLQIKNLIVDIGTCQITCTASIGGASAHGRAADLDHLLVQAGEAVQRAKQAGRDRVELLGQSLVSG